jgi:hypothetical protein
MTFFNEYPILFQTILMFVGLIISYFLLNFLLIKKLKIKITKRQLAILIIGLYYLIKLIFSWFD